MRKRFDWRKPRYNRSYPNIIRGKAAREISIVLNGRNISEDPTTQWKSPISKDTFDELVEKGTLSKVQIEQYLHGFIRKNMGKKNKSVRNKIAKSEDFDLIIKLSKLDLKTKEGSKVFGDILKENPKALLLLGDAQKLRSAM